MFGGEHLYGEVQPSVVESDVFGFVDLLPLRGQCSLFALFAETLDLGCSALRVQHRVYVIQTAISSLDLKEINISYEFLN